MIDRSELEEMVASSSCGTVFVAPTVTSDGSFWSFLIHDSVNVIESIAAIAPGSGSADHYSEAGCAMLDGSGPGNAEVKVVAFLFRFTTDPPEIYSAFMNPVHDFVKGLLEDLTRQDRLFIEFYNDTRLMALSIENRVKEQALQILAALEDLRPFTEEAFDIFVDELVSRHPEPALIHELLNGTT